MCGISSKAKMAKVLIVFSNFEWTHRLSSSLRKCVLTMVSGTSLLLSHYPVLPEILAGNAALPLTTELSFVST